MTRTRYVQGAVLAAGLAVAGAVEAQEMRPLPSTPYRAVDDAWATPPDGLTWGASSAIDVAPDGRSIWVAERCGANDCRGNSTRPTVFHFDLDGKLLHAFGAGMLNWPHGIDVDHEGNVWVTDGREPLGQTIGAGAADTQGAAPPTATSATVWGYQVLKFSPTGELLMALGQPGGSRGPNGYFWQPNDVLVTPEGNIFVAEGHGGGAGTRARILKFDANGRFLLQWGELGAGEGQFSGPHALAMDSQGRLFVADRSNGRIQIFDQEGEHLATWTQFGRPSDVFIDDNDILYATDSESDSTRNPGFRRGVYIGSARDGWVTEFIPDPIANPDEEATSGGEGVAVDATGAVYTAEITIPRIRKFVK